ncbi:MAG TPA: SDR family NAD(P)-dependent oxidoreductase [Lichenihabitans sp.]|nr:SDR family NAD(P)-dependent oxidoreductase [Lichenihabitans sp.]
MVNNAGVGAARLVVDIELEEWERMIQVNLTGALLCGQQAARHMIKQGTGGRAHPQHRVAVRSERAMWVARPTAPRRPGSKC